MFDPTPFSAPVPVLTSPAPPFSESETLQREWFRTLLEIIPPSYVQFFPFARRFLEIWGSFLKTSRPSRLSAESSRFEIRQYEIVAYSFLNDSFATF